MTYSTCLGRSWRLLAASAVAGALAFAPASHAAPDTCGPTLEPAQAETLLVRLAPVTGLRVERATPVELQVRRDGADATALTGLEGAHVSVRVRSGRITSYVDGTLDAAGRASLAVTLDRRSPAGAADITADVWADAAPQHGCQQVVREHGAARARTRVSR